MNCIISTPDELFRFQIRKDSLFLQWFDFAGRYYQQQSTKKRKEQVDASPRDDSLEMIDVEKEVQNLFTDPVTHLRVLPILWIDSSHYNP